MGTWGKLGQASRCTAVWEVACNGREFCVETARKAAEAKRQHAIDQGEG